MQSPDKKQTLCDNRQSKTLFDPNLKNKNNTLYGEYIYLEIEILQIMWIKIMNITFPGIRCGNSNEWHKNWLIKDNLGYLINKFFCRITFFNLHAGIFYQMEKDNKPKDTRVSFIYVNH